ncbi:8-oxo-dGTP pyrophosphatase MutT (NUDIX family) [Thermocatellispora tengchongensis]|uniref:8-oxo-dGTP pyrophosphatase MutT (NUDIX family) n=1 Tax=Thermocatellispora tengchongensis TaxID=1073253 RepID=A0A840PSF8_9ACTN|nr:NUDIX domain-containing protein [Thermocatellispora tengchongensis]MBB5138885.1 8-oxo-dGTP pyrophosphatase MutT (NUDIX family) [Thermocatellispora tengchongensis]
MRVEVPGAYRTAGAGERVALLQRKLLEETGEYLGEGTPEELAGILEVVYALAAERHGLGREDLESVRAARAAARGGLTRDTVLRDEPPPVRHSVRAVLLDGDDLVLFRRVRPGRAPYWITPGGRIEPGDASPEAALRRELDEELGATTGPVLPLVTLGEPGARYSVFACRLRSLDLSRRTGPEFDDPAAGTHEIRRVPCTPEAIRAVDLVPEALAGFLAANAAAIPALLDAATAPGRYRPVVDVHLLLVDGEKVLLGRRRDTGYADGEWHIMPSGHLEEGESVLDTAVREAREELGVRVSPADIEPAHVMHHRNAGGTARIGLFFVCRRGYGTPVNAEPHKCAELGWFPADALPPDTVPYAAAGVRAVAEGRGFSLHGWHTPSPAELRAEAARAGYGELAVAVVARRGDAVLVLSDAETDRLPSRLLAPGESLEAALEKALEKAPYAGPRFVRAEDYVPVTGGQGRRFYFAAEIPEGAPIPPLARLLPAAALAEARLPVAERHAVRDALAGDMRARR